MMTTDPVCGKRMVERTAGAATLYRGKLYYFCGEEHRDQFLADPERYAPNAPAMALKVGVMGAASGDLPLEIRQAAFDLGAYCGEQGLVVLSGAAPGYPWDSARGAQSKGGLSVGISPALSLDEHVNVYHSPADAFDVLIFTGSGLMGREIVNIRSSNIVVIVGGHSGTLGEFAIAYDEGKLIGVLEGSGGIADEVDRLVEAINKPTGALVLYDSEPRGLVDKLIRQYVDSHYQHASIFQSGDYSGKGAALPG
jgi:uncharacterized protein (TIGR00725 family)